MSSEAGFDTPAAPIPFVVQEEAAEKVIAGTPGDIDQQIVAEALAVAEDTPNRDEHEGKEEEAGPSKTNGTEASGINFLFDDDSSDEETMVTIGDIKQNLPYQKPSSTAIAGKLDVDGQPTINGQMIYDVDLATMEDKPWQKPGADLTDYFNYGFNEETWNLYCERQKKFRAEFGTQKEINRAILGGINFAPVAPQIPVLNQGGRQLVNVVGPDKPQKVGGNFMLEDLGRTLHNDVPVKIMPVVRTVITGNSTPQSSSYDNQSPDPSTMGESASIPVVNFNKLSLNLLQSFGTNSPSSSPLHNGGDGPPGVEDSGTSASSLPPPFDASVPPPSFNPNVPPPGLPMGQRSNAMGQTNMNVPPPLFGSGVPMYASAGFNQPAQFNSIGRVPPLMGREFRRRGSSEESEDEYSRRKRRRRSRSISPRRRRDDRSRDYRDDRDRDRESSSRSRRHEDRGHKRSRYDEDYDREKRRKHERSERTERSGRTRSDDRHRSEDESEAPPGMEAD